MVISSAVNVLSTVMIRRASSKSEARRFAMRIPMEALLDKRSLVQPFVVATIVGEYRMLVRCREL